MINLPAHIRQLRRAYRRAKLFDTMTPDELATCEAVLYPKCGRDKAKCAARDIAWVELEKQTTKAANSCGLTVGSWGDGSILQWIKDHWREILRIFLMVLPLFL